MNMSSFLHKYGYKASLVLTVDGVYDKKTGKVGKFTNTIDCYLLNLNETVQQIKGIDQCSRTVLIDYLGKIPTNSVVQIGDTVYRATKVEVVRIKDMIVYTKLSLVR